MVIVPLRYRLPNDTSKNLDKRLRSLIETLEPQPPLMCFVGDVIDVVRQAFLVWQNRRLSPEQRRSGVVYLRLDSPLDVHGLYRQILDVFEHLSPCGLEDDALHTFSTDEMWAQVIDLADIHQLGFVIDDAHRIDPEVLHYFAHCIKLYACSACWFFVGDQSLLDVIDLHDVTHVCAHQEPTPLPLDHTPLDLYHEHGGLLLDNDPELIPEHDALCDTHLQVLCVLSTSAYAVLSEILIQAFALDAFVLPELRDRGLVEATPTGLILTPRGADLCREQVESGVVNLPKLRGVADHPS